MPPIILNNIEQGSPEWFSAKAGSPGASSIDNIITTTGARSKSRESYMMQLAGEKITGTCEETFQSKAMQNGIEREAAARALFEMIHGVEVQQVGIVYKDEHKLSHCSPDGLIGKNAGFEVKNPMMKTHIKYLMGKKLPIDYFGQIQMSLYVTERETWWFMSHYIGLPPLIIECHRDEAFQKRLTEELDAFNTELLTLVERIKAMQ
ncbi:MAG: YqaJ viral recombinase family protein [Eubacteriales bacterium]|nr:YqaJ viral recombinase family protein [Eubacteriales bacterium]